MAALVDAARRGVGVDGLTLYTTTFPRHDCAKHIVAAGIQRVVYIEPYPKSLSVPLYPDSIAVDGVSTDGGLVDFQPFVGIGPRRYVDIFTAPERKTQLGDSVVWDPANAHPKLGAYDPTTTVREADMLKGFSERIREIGLTIAD